MISLNNDLVLNPPCSPFSKGDTTGQNCVRSISEKSKLLINSDQFSLRKGDARGFKTKHQFQNLILLKYKLSASMRTLRCKNIG